MKTLEKFDFTRQSSRSNYDWDSLLDGGIHVLEEGKDFTSKAITMQSRARTVAKKMGLKVRFGKTKEGNLVLQSYEAPAEDEFAKVSNAGKKAKSEKADEAAGPEDEDIDEDGEEGEEVAEEKAAPEAPKRRRR